MGPMPEIPGQAGAFIGALASSGYLYVIAGLQVVGGLCLLIGSRFVPLGLTLLGRVVTGDPEPAHGQGVEAHGEGSIVAGAGGGHSNQHGT